MPTAPQPRLNRSQRPGCTLCSRKPLFDPWRRPSQMPPHERHNRRRGREFKAPARENVRRRGLSTRSGSRSRRPGAGGPPASHPGWVTAEDGGLQCVSRGSLDEVGRPGRRAWERRASGHNGLGTYGRGRGQAASSGERRTPLRRRHLPLCPLVRQAPPPVGRGPDRRARLSYARSVASGVATYFPRTSPYPLPLTPLPRPRRTP